MSIRQMISEAVANARSKESNSNTAYAEVESIVKSEEEKPLSAAIFGQTGVGKSSLINSIFGTNFAVDDVRPCTKSPQSHQARDESGNEIIFWDLPGIGESEDADRSYLDMYLAIAKSSDVIFWAFQADTRSVGVDTAAFKHITAQLKAQSNQQYVDFISKVCVVMTKVDAVSEDSWIFCKKGDDLIVQYGPLTEKVLERKSIHFREQLFGESLSHVVTKSPITSENKTAKSPKGYSIDTNRLFISYQGYLTEDLANIHIEAWPNWKREIETILQTQKCVGCSARLKFNVQEVIAQMSRRAQGSSYLRLKKGFQRKRKPNPWVFIGRAHLPTVGELHGDKYISYFDVSTIINK